MSDRISHVHPGELRESAINPRQIDPQRFDALKHALEADPDMLDARPLIADTNGEVVAGNMRLRAIKDMIAGIDTPIGAYPRLNAFIDRRGGVPVAIYELDDKRRREIMLRDNQPYGEYVESSLQALLADYTALPDADPLLTGFEPDEIDRLLGNGPDTGDDPTGDADVDPEPDVWGVVVECDNEDAQVELLERLDAEGYNVRALL
ncbi:hypothetical protein [Mycobacterium sp.]|uniref:hypothetical protein n=1 Tax=Mycobacterium sp. TaxID=1785 RepID=UPI002614753A|nr:hypothetical protein [Mycobacterium sp.]